MANELERSTKGEIEEYIIATAAGAAWFAAHEAKRNGSPLGPLRQAIVDAFDEAAKELTGE